MSMIIGLDIHSKKTVYVAQNEQGEEMDRGQIPTTAEGFAELIHRLQPDPGTPIGLEAGTGMGWIVATLTRWGLNPQALDAREVRVRARRQGQKSDYRDAWEICDGLRRDLFCTRVFVPNPTQARLRLLLSRRRHFVKVATAEINAVKFLLRQHGRPYPVKSLTSAGAWLKLLAAIDDPELQTYLTLHHRLWKLATEQAADLQKRIADAAAPYREQLRRLQTMPGVGPLTAAAFVAVVGEPQRFSTSSHLASYLGLTPSTYDSGERERHGHITKRGSAYLRALLCEASQQARRPSHPLNPYWRRICAKSGYKKAIVAVAHRLARILWRMWRDQTDFEVEQLNVVYEPQLVTRTQYYRLATV